MMGVLSEAAREREAYRYDPFLLPGSIVNEGPEPLDPSLLSTSSDAALTAFAQLAALRLNVERALISLFDLKYQHIIAEATRSTALVPESRGHGQGDRLWLSGTAIPRGHSVCEHVLVDDEAKSGKGIVSADTHLSVTVIPDLASDARISADPPIGLCSTQRFYAGVPIRSSKGINIGVLCVYDPVPRESLDAASVQALQNISRIIMTYLQTRKSEASFHRNERMVRGLGTLIEGKASMSQWWLTTNPSSFSDRAGFEGSLNTKQQTIQRLDEQRLDEVHVHPPIRPLHPSVPPPPSNFAPDVTPEDLPGMLNERTELALPALSSNDTTYASTKSITSTTGTQGDDIRALFSRAANIIRESIQIEGVLFLDATISSFGGLVANGSSESQSWSDSSRDSPTSSNEDSAGGSDTMNQTLCKILGYSMSTSSSIDGDRANASHLSVPEKFLKELLRRYPSGHIFSFDATGAIQTSDSSGDDSGAVLHAEGKPESQRRSKRRLPRQTIGDTLINIFTNARSIILIPLWDSHKERWFAGAFGWTQNPSRVFSTQGDLSYLKAFGMSIMSEVARIQSLQAGKAKGDVLGSLSHELRSPLHGVVLGVELLHDTPLSGFQEDVLHTLETCGRTLLDTVDHLLDYSKINHYLKASRKHRISGQGRGLYSEKSSTVEAGMMAISSDIQLDALAEDVIESVYAGFSFQQQSAAWGTRSKTNKSDYTQLGTLRRVDSIRPTGSTNDGMSSMVSVYLTIDPNLPWGFFTQPGAIRRVIMNLFGNALKYTSRGWVAISLTQETLPEKSKSRRSRRVVVLSISDSGKGISEDYLRHQLFTPFAQEDHLSPGAGLGLSLVKQITSALRGTINVSSQLGHGTTVRISLPLHPINSTAGEVRMDQDTAFSEQVEGLKDLPVCLIGFHEDPRRILNNPKLSTPGLNPLPQAMMENLCRSWFHMNIVPGLGPEGVQPRVIICTAESFAEVPVSTPTQQPPAPILVICRSILAAHELATSHTSYSEHQIHEFISQPIGPRKLAKVLTLIVKKYQVQSQSFQLVKPESATQVPSVPVDPDADADLTPRPLESRPARPPTVPYSITELPEKGGDQSPNKTGSLDSGEAGPSPAMGEGGSSYFPPKQYGTPTFLLVDDNAINLKILAAYMKKLGRQYDTAVDGVEALEGYRQAPTKYRCIFMDISMPVMDGLESSRLIRAFESQNKLPRTLIIALTGLASKHTQQEAFASGIDLFLTKPVRLKELGRIMEAHDL